MRIKEEIRYAPCEKWSVVQNRTINMTDYDKNQGAFGRDKRMILPY